MSQFNPGMKPVTNYETGTVVASAQLDVSPQLAYKALTEPAIFEQWWGSDDTYHMKDWIADIRPGGHYTVNVVNADGAISPASGTYLEIEEGVKMVYTRRYDWDFPGLGRRETTITYLLEPFESGTLLTILHKGFTGFDQAARAHADGWERVISWLQAYLKSLN